MANRTVVVVADSHFCEDSRFEECIRLHKEISDWVAENKPSLVVHCGDLFERKSTPRERTAAAEWLQECATSCPVAMVSGNHDAHLDVDFMSRLEAHHPIRTFEYPDTHTIGGVRLSLLPWPRKANLLAALGDVSQEQAGQVAQDALRNVLRGLYQPSGYESPRLFVGHVMVRGSVTSLGQPLVGMDMELGLDALALVDADAYALGHIHAAQSWAIGDAPCFYPGSPRRTAFGELEAKGFTVIRFTEELDRWSATTEFVELSATRMVLIDAEYSDGQFVFRDDPTSIEGAEVRLRYRCQSDERDAARERAVGWREHWIKAGAVSVKLEPEVIAVTRSRAPEVAKAGTLSEQVQAFWTSKCYEPGTRRESLLGKLALLEGASL
jgi:DNA repair exonuclease SbcCD nuclease subunit